MCGKETASLLKKCLLLSSIAYILLIVYIWRSSRISYEKSKTSNKPCSEYFCSSSHCPGKDAIEDSSKWIVFVDSNHTALSKKKLQSLRGWNVVIIGDKRTQVKRKFSGMKNIHFITTQQQELGFSPQMLLHGSVRKIVGYLYAFRNGAKFIYDLDQDMEVNGEDLSLFDYDESVSGLVYSTRNDLPARRTKTSAKGFIYVEKLNLQPSKKHY
ncbi:hypothetical protein Y032_0003g1444 [Ancylostoma ceylanicum]|nr:hypothetical protein Y032_0003g1444 [Ancylostoma ceylanicum]